MAYSQGAITALRTNLTTAASRDRRGQVLQQFDDRSGDGTVHRDNHRMLVRAGRFERFELAAQQSRRHIAVLPRDNAVVD